MLKTRVNEILGIRYPILQGGMAWISGWAMAAAVSKAGGLGTIASATMEPEELAKYPKTPGSLAEAIDALEKDHKFLITGGVFTNQQHGVFVSHGHHQHRTVRGRVETLVLHHGPVGKLQPYLFHIKEAGTGNGLRTQNSRLFRHIR